MKKIVLAMAAASVVGFSASAQAASTVCVFDLLGKAGDSYKMMEEWALAAKGWGTEINLVPRQDEAVADNDFKAGKCDAVALVNITNLPDQLTRLAAFLITKLHNVLLLMY